MDTDKLAEKVTRPRRPPTPGQRLLTAQQAEEVFGVPLTSLRDLHFRGELPVVRLGRRWWFDRIDLERLIDRSREVIAR